MIVFGELEVGGHDLAWQLLLRLVEADQRREKGCLSAIPCQLWVLMGVDSVLFSSYENMSVTGIPKRQCGGQHMEIPRKEELRQRRGGDDTMAYGVGRRRSSSTPRPIPAQAHDSPGPRQLRWCRGILKAKKGS